MTNFRPSRNRDAWAAIRGYIYQVDLTMMRWLDLQPGEILELEHGEDIDLVSQAFGRAGKTQKRLLEQVKHREVSSLTLRSDEAIAALTNAFEHRTSNPDTVLIFRYTTNARIGCERGTPLPGKKAGIHIWKQISEGQMSEPIQEKALRGLRALLCDAIKPDDIPVGTWQKFRSFLQTSNDDQFLAFVQAFEWSMGNADAHRMRENIQQRLISELYAVDLVQAQEQYQRLFLHIFLALSQRGMKRLTVENRNYQLSLPLLSEQEHRTLDSIKNHLELLEQRVDVLERNHLQLKQGQRHMKAQVQRMARDQNKERSVRLRSMLIDHSGFMHDRLSSFVGRILELEEIKQYIAQLQLTGGYFTITGQAGQGKSSIIAKLIQLYGITKVAFHFIPLNPGPDYQVELLRNIIAQLLLKHHIFDPSVESEQRTLLRSSLSRLLTQITAKNGREVIFIDGLDQLQEDYNGTRDLSFLPNSVPPGIVFVLGTRPNDTLEPLTLLKPIEQYQVPGLSRQDFDLILHHRHISLESKLADQFYDAMQANALFLDLVAKELQEKGAISPQEMIARITHNPENLFSLAITRLKRQPIEWREVIKPVLGLLLVAQEPLFIGHIKQILKIQHDRLWDGIMRLGGLLTEDKQHRYSLFHLKLQRYLRQGEDRSPQGYIFDTDDEEYWHKTLTTWCEREPLPLIWKNAKDFHEQERRRYARQYYLLHLYSVKRGERLFEILDEYTYGQAKVHVGPGMPSYIADLDLGCQAATWQHWTMEEGLKYLPHLWRYTLLRSSLASLADNYPDAAFSLLILLKRVPEAIGLAELLTDTYRKVRISLLIAQYMILQPDQRSEGIQIALQVFERGLSLKDSIQRSEVFSELGMTLAQAELWEKTEEVLEHIVGSDRRAMVLGELGRAFAKAGQQSKAEESWKKAQEAITAIHNKEERLEALNALGIAFAKAKQWERARSIFEEVKNTSAILALKEWQNNLLEIGANLGEDDESKKKIEEMISITEDTDKNSNWLKEREKYFVQAKQWQQAQKVIVTIENDMGRIGALSELGKFLLQAQEWERAEEVWRDIKRQIRFIKDERTKIEALGELGKALAQAKQWRQAEKVWREIVARVRIIKDDTTRAEALSELGLALAKASEWEKAETVIRSIEENNTKLKALISLGSILAKRGQQEKANTLWGDTHALIQTTPERITRLWALDKLGKALAQAQRWEKTEEVIQLIDNLYLKAETQRELAKAFAMTEEWDKAETVIRSIQDRSAMVEGLKDMVALLIQAQEWKRAEETLYSLDNRYWQSKALLELGSALIQTGRKEKAEEVWKKAELVIQSLDERNMRSGTGENIFMKSQKWKKAGDVMQTIGGRSVKSWALSGLGRVFAQIQQWEKAELVIRSIEDERTKAEMLGELGSMLLQTQKEERAEILLGDAEILSHSIVDRDVKSWTLRGVGRVFAQIQQWEKAEKIFKTIDERSIKLKALREFGEMLANAGERERAKRVWQEVEEMIQTLEEEKAQSAAMRELGNTFIQAQEWERAEALASVIQERDNKLEILRELAKALASVHDYEHLLHFVQRAWLQANTRNELLLLISLSTELISLEPKLGMGIFDGFAWVDTFLREEGEKYMPGQ